LGHGPRISGNQNEPPRNSKTLKPKAFLARILKNQASNLASQASDEGSIPFTLSMIFGRRLQDR
jgi:hypothetical protein